MLTIGRRVYLGRHRTKAVVVVKKGGTSRDFGQRQILGMHTGIGVDRFLGNNRDYHHPGGEGGGAFNHASTRKDDERTQ